MRVLLICGGVAPYFTKRYHLLQQLQKQGHSVFLAGTEWGFQERIAAEGMTFVPIAFARAGKNPISDLKMLMACYHAIKDNQISVVHSYTAKPNIYGSIAARMAGVGKIYPVVNGLGYVYGENGSILLRFLSDLLYRIAFACATKVFFQNPDDRDLLLRRRVLRREKGVVVSGSGIDLQAYPASPAAANGVFLMASRLLISKGTRVYLQAAKIVKEKYPDTTFQLAGGLDPNPDGITAQELAEYVSSGVIDYLGVVSDMPSALRACMVFVLPSYYREGVPHVLLEAMSVGRALITADSPGCRETVNGKNGFLVPPKDASALAEKLIWCIEHPEQVTEMGAESRRYAAERFDVRIVDGQILEEMGLLEHGTW